MAHTYRMLERMMEQPPKASRPSRKRITTLEVHTMFELSRLAQQYLQDAYAFLIPTVRRCLGQVKFTVNLAQIFVARKDK